MLNCKIKKYYYIGGADFNQINIKYFKQMLLDSKIATNLDFSTCRTLTMEYWNVFTFDIYFMNAIVSENTHVICHFYNFLSYEIVNKVEIIYKDIFVKISLFDFVKLLK